LREEYMKINNGTHLILDGNGSKGKLDDEVLIEEFLENLVNEIKMNKLSDVVIKRVDSMGEKNGVTGFVLLRESHISIHTFPKNGFFHADVFSCKDFDVDLVLGLFNKVFLIEKFEKKIIKREYERG